MGVYGGCALAGGRWVGAGCLAGGYGALEVRPSRRRCPGRAPGGGRGVTRTCGRRTLGGSRAIFARWVTPLGVLGGRWVALGAFPDRWVGAGCWVGRWVGCWVTCRDRIGALGGCWVVGRTPGGRPGVGRGAGWALGGRAARYGSAGWWMEPPGGAGWPLDALGGRGSVAEGPCLAQRAQRGGRGGEVGLEDFGRLDTRAYGRPVGAYLRF